MVKKEIRMADMSRLNKGRVTRVELQLRNQHLGVMFRVALMTFMRSQSYRSVKPGVWLHLILQMILEKQRGWNFSIMVVSGDTGDSY